MTVFQMGETEVWDHTACKWQIQNWNPYYLGPDTSERQGLVAGPRTSSRGFRFSLGLA